MSNNIRHDSALFFGMPSTRTPRMLSTLLACPLSFRGSMPPSPVTSRHRPRLCNNRSAAVSVLRPAAADRNTYCTRTIQAIRFCVAAAAGLRPSRASGAVRACTLTARQMSLRLPLISARNNLLPVWQQMRLVGERPPSPVSGQVIGAFFSVDVAVDAVTHSPSGRSVEYPSGQRGQTVNLLAYAFIGSNPISTTTLNPSPNNASSLYLQPDRHHAPFLVVRLYALAGCFRLF